MQHGRITDPRPALLSDPRSSLIQRRVDVDLFIVSLHRLHTVAELAAEVADPRNVLSGALDLFSGLTAGLPLSAFSDFRGDHPLIELRDPKEVVRPWRPGSEITARQTATMAQIHADLRTRARSTPAETEP